jgi:hypothetical protein
MAIPDFQTVMLPLLKLAGQGEEHGLADAIDGLAREFQLSDEERRELLPSGKQARFDNRVGWAVTYLKKARLLGAVGRGRFAITKRGKEVLAEPPRTIDIAFLSGFPEMADFRRRSPSDRGDVPAALEDGKWVIRDGVKERIRQKIERSIPAESTRRAALGLLAYAIENADEERADAWYLRETSRGLALIAGRQLACKVAGSKARVSVIGPITEEVRNTLGAEPEDDEEFKTIPGGVLLTIPIEQAGRALELLKDGLNSFVDLAMARIRRAVILENHCPEAVLYVADVVGRELPQPEEVLQPPEEEQDDDVGAEQDATLSREPRIRGRAPIFEHGQRSIASLMSDIEQGTIALPDLQRPFVWEDTKVRDLLDSLLLGFPVGTLVLWHTSNEKDARAFGADRPGLRATTLVIDGQQRLTSLYAVLRGVEVVGKDGERRRIVLAFRPRDGRFEVTDAAIRNDPEFLPNVTEIWSGARPKSQIRRDLMNALRDKGRAVDEKYEDAAERNLEVAHAISDYRFPTVDIRKTTNVSAEEASEEDVSDIFVRINNQGKRLGQADFVLTLLSVFHGELRDSIENRAREMSDGAVVAIDTQQLLRAACGVAFGRARMSAVYRFLRGFDATSGETDIAARQTRLDQLDEAAKQCIEPTTWRDFLLRVKHAGFVSPALIPSKNAIVNAYTFYVRGRTIGVPKAQLDELISRWLFGTLLTARYSTSSESVFEEDLQRVSGLGQGDVDNFVAALDAALGEQLTGDYWTQTLVGELETQKARAPGALAFRAAQIVLGARALFSDQLLQNLLDPSVDGGRAASEAHHLFPKAWLQATGIRERRLVNQVANLADVGWHDNSTVGSQGPAKYVPRFRDKLGLDDDAWGRLCAEHALPLGWESMEYLEFLPERRSRMAEIVRVAYRKLGGVSASDALPPPWFLPGAALVWERIAQTEQALRALVRQVYVANFGESAASRIRAALPESERVVLERALRAHPAAGDAPTIVDYLYIAQLPSLLFAGDVWQAARLRLGDRADTKQRLQTAVAQIAPVRNEIAHVREVAREQLQRADLACGDLLQMLGAGSESRR